LAFENTHERNYVSEKADEMSFMGTLPVSWGDQNAYELAPRKSMIDAKKFVSPREPAMHLCHLKSNRTSSNEYRAWRNVDHQQHSGRRLLYSQKTHPIYSLLSRVHKIWVDPYLKIRARNNSRDTRSRTLGFIGRIKSNAGPVFPQTYQHDFKSSNASAFRRFFPHE
jgi:hypothetical protein